MTDQSLKYLIDSDVLIQAHRTYYAFDICTGFWDAIINNQHIVSSIDKILDEINTGSKPDELKKWVKDDLSSGFFESTNDPDVVNEYTVIANWVNSRSFTAQAKAEFFAAADGWLIAFAKAKNRIVITQEKPDPLATGVIKIPDVCNGVGVHWKGTYDLLRELGIKLII